eukprot:TRINITY_DN18661_c1_g1_i2.p2 TRINITY_DN18661_c1_g1~~TRINITY_DN18661_c1_g1_i2.p2  ORF type:complete len:558 (-),score=84.30 TRINITY_DN18661_c1_g1_i2:39-1712(-)
MCTIRRGVAAGLTARMRMIMMIILKNHAAPAVVGWSMLWKTGSAHDASAWSRCGSEISFQHHRTLAVKGAAAIAALESRAAELKIAEGEHHRMAEVQRARAELELESLAARAAEAERREASATLAAAVLPPELQAAIAEEERALDLQRRNLASIRAGCGDDPEVTSVDEQQYREWCRMLGEDRAEHRALCVAEAARDGWAQNLRHLLATVAFATPEPIGSEHGLGRLDAELHGIGMHERMRHATCDDCLRRLSEDGSWRLLYGEIRDAYKLTEQLRERNDELSSDLAALRKRRQRCVQIHEPALPPHGFGGATSSTVPMFRSSSVGATSAPRRPMSATATRGPRFQSPAALFKTSSHEGRPGADDAPSERQEAPVMPKPVVSDSREWEASGREPVQKNESGGLAYLLDGNSGHRRFRPGAALVPSFEDDPGWDAPSPASCSASPAPTSAPTPARPAVAVVEQPRVPNRAPTAAELARRAASRFAEPLSASLGDRRRSRGSRVGALGAGSRSCGPTAVREHSRGGSRSGSRQSGARSVWVKFEANNPGNEGRPSAPLP